MYAGVYVCVCLCVCVRMHKMTFHVLDKFGGSYGVASVSRIDEMIGLICKRAL